MRAVVDQALRVSVASATWTLSASAAAIAVGLIEGSLALVAFGAVQLFDFIADVLLVVHFRAGAEAEHLERAVLRVVSSGLVATGLVTAGFGVVHLRGGQGPGDSRPSVILAGVSVFALVALSLRKRYLAKRLDSAGLRADGNLTAVGATLAAITVAGTAAAGAFDWWWADPLAALCIALGAIGIGWRTWPRNGDWTVGV